MQLDFKGGSGEVGRSAVLVNEEVLLDYGIKPGDYPEYPLDGIFPKTVLVSHGHLDHCGAVANLMDLAPEVYMSPMTSRFTQILGKDTLKISEDRGIPTPYDERDLQVLAQRTRLKEVGENFKSQGYSVQFYDAGHIPGACGIYLEDPTGKSLFYTGDISTTDTRLVSGAKEFPEADVLIIESTYYSVDHPPRKETERKFIESLYETLDIGGTVLIPAFAIGRTQEIMMLLQSEGIPAYVDGMGLRMFKEMLEHPDSVRSPKELSRAFEAATLVRGANRKQVELESSVIVTTAGMLNGGPVLYYLEKLYNDPKAKIILTGYQVEGTNGRLALERGMIENNDRILHLKPKIEQYDFSAHCGEKELKEIVNHFCRNGTEVVFTMHGDGHNTKGFAKWVSETHDIPAYAPENGETYIVD
ncbi:MBL fold metallo-hydrolase [Methanohalophilus sp.]|uniref:MBL fold metallo-hydrolase n=1 Tax=Methanohalophilus sp. TaxID=1966352 RepID=UPI00262BD229|nr:MBL fold metallo-hydrolase [Methanohalophilus sp.]MDK2892061.1 putative mRNA 3-end processing factor [Methanohalophilus sp.]